MVNRDFGLWRTVLTVIHHFLGIFGNFGKSGQGHDEIQMFCNFDPAYFSLGNFPMVFFLRSASFLQDPTGWGCEWRSTTFRLGQHRCPPRVHGYTQGLAFFQLGGEALRSVRSVGPKIVVAAELPWSDGSSSFRGRVAHQQPG